MGGGDGGTDGGGRATAWRWREQANDPALSLPERMPALGAGVLAEHEYLHGGDARGVGQAAQPATQPTAIPLISRAWQMQGHTAVPWRRRLAIPTARAGESPWGTASAAAPTTNQYTNSAMS